MWQPCKYWGNWLRPDDTEHALHSSSAIGLLFVAQASLRLHAQHLTVCRLLDFSPIQTHTRTLAASCTRNTRAHTQSPRSTGSICRRRTKQTHTRYARHIIHTHTCAEKPNAARSSAEWLCTICSQRSLKRGLFVCDAAVEQSQNDRNDRDGRLPNERFCYFSGT